MEAMEAIHTRRSIREFTAQPLATELVDELVGAAMMAPSAGNARPWQFIVIDDPAVKREIPRIHPYAAMAVDAPVSILVCGDLSKEKYPGNWVADCSAATQNLLLAAHAKGVGGVWTGVYPDEARIKAFRQLLGLPEQVVPLALLPIGYPTHPPGRQDRFERAKIHRNRW
ncbi:MAG: nitroreductase family protein [Candidatus Latescibacterota bacterium]|jgi:nitroreductase